MELPDLYGLQNHHLWGKGVCIHCGVALPGTKLVAPRCDACNAGYRALYHKRVDAGLCPRCHSPAMTGYVHCERHVRGKPRVRVPAPAVIRWSFHRLHGEHVRITGESERLLADLWAMADGNDETTLLEFVLEAESDREEALSDLWAESGWSPEDYMSAASDTMVIGDGRVVRKAVGVVVHRAAWGSS